MFIFYDSVQIFRVDENSKGSGWQANYHNARTQSVAFVTGVKTPSATISIICYQLRSRFEIVLARSWGLATL